MALNQTERAQLGAIATKLRDMSTWHSGAKEKAVIAVAEEVEALYGDDAKEADLKTS